MEPKSQDMEYDDGVYVPNLFNRNDEVPMEYGGTQVIPQNTYYDTGMAMQHSVEARHVCVFGITSSNRKDVVAKIKRTAAVKRIENGPNYVNVFCDEVEDLERLVALNLSKVNGEIIGVYRKNFGLVQKTEIYENRKGIFTSIKEYLFGN